VQALLDQGRDVEALLQGEGEGGPLRLGATLTIGNYLAPLLLGEFMGGRPEESRGRVHLEVHNTATVIRQVANFELDFGLIEGVCQHPDLEVSPWIEDELAVFAAPDHALAGRRTPRSKTSWPNPGFCGSPARAPARPLKGRWVHGCPG